MTASDHVRRAEAIATGMNRNLDVAPIAWGELLAIAQREMGRFQQQRGLGRADELYEEETASPLIAAARIILEVAQRAHTSEDADAGSTLAMATARLQERRTLLLLASSAFAMYGNFPSAAAVQRFLEPNSLSTEGQWLAAAISNPRQIAAALASRTLTEPANTFLERLSLFLTSGDELIGDALIDQLELLMITARPPSEVSLLRAARLTLKHITKLAMSRL